MTQPDTTITANPKTLTPAQLREALDAWAEDQPGVNRKDTDLNFEPGWEASIWSPVCDMQVGKKGATAHWEIVGILLENKGAITFEAKDWAVLLWLAIEHEYLPWLSLVANLLCPGTKTAGIALAALREPTEQEEEERRAQAEALFWNDEVEE